MCSVLLPQEPAHMPCVSLKGKNPLCMSLDGQAVHRKTGGTLTETQEEKDNCDLVDFSWPYKRMSV